MKTKNSVVCCLIALLALPVLGAFAEAPAAFSVQLITTFDYPRSGISIAPQKISDSGDIVGTVTERLVQRGFVRFRNGNFSPLIVHPKDTGGITQGRGINNSRLVCGDYQDAGSATLHGFFLRGGMFHNFDVPGSTFTVINGVNNAGDFCGWDLPGSGVALSFVSIGGVITEFTVPQATASVAQQINSSNQVCGYFSDGSSNHGYYRDSDGTIYAPIDPAGSTDTIIFGNNDSNWMVGRYEDSGGLTHGLLFIPPNKYITYDYPGSTFTSLNGINAEGKIVGRYLNPSSGIEHGIIARVVRSAADQSTPGVTPQRQSSQPGSLPSGSQVEVPAF